MIELAFDPLCGWRGTRYEYEPPRPVWFELGRALPPQRLRQDDNPLRVRAPESTSPALRPRLMW